MYNHCVFLGLLKNKPVFHTTGKGKVYVTFTLSVTRNFPDSQGNWISDDIDCIAWNKLADKIYNKNYDAGDMLHVSSRFQTRTTTGNDGTNSVVAEFYVLTCERVSKNHSPSPSGTLISGNYTPQEQEDSPLPF